MFKSRKRGQLTIFIILGVIILVMFSYMFYERSEKEKQEMFETINNQVTNIFQSTAMQNYVEICVEEKTNEALRILGDQGGYIFEDQGGTIPRTGSVNLGNHSMKYALDYDPTSPNCHPLFCPLVPIYPYRKIIDPAAPDIFKKLFNTSKINTTSPKSAYYGFVIGRFPALCLEDGLNWNASNGCHSAGYSPKGQNSIQEQLQDYIDNNLDDCLNFSSLFNDTGVYAHFDIEEKNTTTTIFFGESDLVVFVDYPLSLYSSTKNFKIVKNRFTVRIPNRIRKVWEHIYTLLSNDARNLFFDKKKPSIIMNPSTRWLSGFSYAYSETVATDDIYLVTDLYSLNKGKDYSFRVLIENRPPVLEYMHEDKNPGFSNRFDYVRLPGDTLELRPIGFDPDEDDVIYEYEGWMEDSYDTFNYSCCSAYGGSVNCVTTPDLCTVQQTDNSRDLNQWTESASYITSNQYAEYKIIDDDIGTHKLTVRVTDPGGLSDWQELNILVVDAPKVIINFQNYYGDVNNTYASLEDPFAFDATKSTSIFGIPGNTYMGIYKLGVFSLVKDLGAGVFAYGLPEGDYDINNITTVPTNRLTSTDTSIQTHTLEVNISNGLIGTGDTRDFNVAECLPHRSLVPSYPYNNYSFDDVVYPNNTANPYQADHTCCEGNASLGDYWNWNISDAGTPCYNFTQYGSIKSFRATEIYDLDGFPVQTIYPPGITGYDSLNQVLTTPSFNTIVQNDIFVREFQRECDGNRGNTCTGTINDDIILHDDCDDTLVFNQQRRCSGPPSNLAGNLFETSSTVSCVDYTRDTFENIFQMPDINNVVPSDNWCDNRTLCTDNPSGSYYGLGGPNSQYISMATCDGAGGCTQNYWDGSSNSYNCWASNTCTDSDSGDYRDWGLTSGHTFVSCDDSNKEYKDTSACVTQDYSNLNDTCLNFYELNETKCYPLPGAQAIPYFSEIINCSDEYPETCFLDTFTGNYQNASPSNCEEDALGNGRCSSPLAYSCDSGYACEGVTNRVDGDVCTQPGTCTHSYQCHDDYFCNTTIGDCEPRLNVGQVCDNSMFLQCNATLDCRQYHIDYDNDGYGNNTASSVSYCNNIGDYSLVVSSVRYVSNNLDCNDANSNAKPLQPEVCDYVDNDCDGFTDEGYFYNRLGTQIFIFSGAGPTLVRNNCQGRYGVCAGFTGQVECGLNPWITSAGRCSGNPDGSFPQDQLEVCNGLDDDCDGSIDEDFDLDLDTWSTCMGDCDDGIPAINPGVAEVCNAIDDNCDGSIDEGFNLDGDLFTTCGMDGNLMTGADNDCCDAGTEPILGCTIGSRGSIYPGATEFDNDGIDSNCNLADDS